MNKSYILSPIICVWLLCSSNAEDIKPQSEFESKIYQSGLQFGKGQKEKLKPRERELFVKGIADGFLDTKLSNDQTSLCGEARELKMKCVTFGIDQAKLGSWNQALKTNREKLTIIDSMCWNIAYQLINKEIIIQNNYYLSVINKEYENIAKNPRWGERKYKAECAKTHESFNPCIKMMITFEDDDIKKCTQSMKD